MSDHGHDRVATSPESEPEQLERHLTLLPATALAVTTVVGGGALALPGVALKQAGSAAVFGWLLAAVITVPLLVVFARLGSRYPSAGGVAGFVQAAFGRHLAAGAEVMLIGTFGLGIPAIALSGGSYLMAVVGAGPQFAWVGAIALLGLASSVLLFGGGVSARVQFVLAIVLTVGLAATGIVGLTHQDAQFSVPDVSGSSLVLAMAVVGTVFFGFTGWEMIAFTTAEYRNPRRDFPRVIMLSFLIVVGVYLLLAAGVQATLSPTDPAAGTAPVAAVMRTAVSPAAASLVSVLGVVILAANLIGAIWGASRLVYSSATEKLLPRPLAVLSGIRRTPRNAVVASAVLFVVMVLSSAFGLLSPTTMFLIAGQNFFLLYLLSAVVYARVAPTTPGRVFGVLVSIGLAAVVFVGFNLLVVGYAIALVLIGTVVSLVTHRRETAVTG